MPAPASSHFAEDAVISAAAESLGLKIDRRAKVIITNEAAIKKAGLMRECPDLIRIRKLLEDGTAIEGAELGRIEFVLRRPQESK